MTHHGDLPTRCLDVGRPLGAAISLHHIARQQSIQSATVNGQKAEFDAAHEWVKIEKPGQRRYSIVVGY
jgi:hypothetical protein